MGLESREYFRDGSYSASLGWHLDITPVVKYLIILNVVVYVLQILITRSVLPEPLNLHAWQNQAQLKPSQADDDDEDEPDPATQQKQHEALRRFREQMMQRLANLPGMHVSVVTEWLQLDPRQTIEQGQVWRLVTSAFCHDPHSLWHILFNMLALYWFGIRLERMYGSTEFTLFYLVAAICSSLAYVGLAYRTGSMAPAIGASGAVMGVMLLYTIYYPFETWLLFWCIPVPLWVLLGGFVIYDLHPVLLSLSGEHVVSRVAHAGHLGGLAFGFVYWRTDIRLERVFGRKWRALKLRPGVTKHVRVYAPPLDELSDRVDTILKKINEHGQESLSDEERNVLIQASAKYRESK